jgi:hypothetical protein
MGIFEDVSRTYLGPANHGEPHWTFLNRSARPESRKARERIEDWFEQLCPALQHGVRDLLRSGDNQKFAAGFWELYLHALFGGLGYDVTCASPTGNGRNIDFLMRRENSAFTWKPPLQESPQRSELRTHDGTGFTASWTNSNRLTSRWGSQFSRPGRMT